MIQKPLSNIQSEDIDGLLRNRVREDRTTEYKSKISLDPDRLMKAVSSFANSIGGDLIFGIQAQDGIPISISGLDPLSIDKEMLRVTQLARTVLQPPLALRDVDFKVVDSTDGRSVLVLRIPQSWARPHQMKSNGIFYARSAVGSYFLDVSELRQAFEMSESLPERINKFIDQQITKISKGVTPIRMVGSAPEAVPRVIFHLIPISAFLANLRIHIGLRAAELETLAPAYSYSLSGISPNYRHRMNLEGWVNFLSDSNKLIEAYTQIHRNGIVEVVIVPDLDSRTNAPPSVDSGYEVLLALAFPDYLIKLAALGIGAPFVLGLSLVNVRKWYFKARTRNLSEYPFDQDIVSVPPLTIEEPGFDTDAALLDLFNIVWQSVGHERSPRDAGGKIKPL
jgi:hypothetical protein